MTRAEASERLRPKLGLDVLLGDQPIRLVRPGPYRGQHDVREPLVEEVRNAAAVVEDREPSILARVHRACLLDRLGFCFAIDEATLSLAVGVPEVDLTDPAPILPLIDAAFAASSSVLLVAHVRARFARDLR